MKVQRIRFCYRLTAAACTLSQRDVIVAWTDAAKAAGIPLAYSEGKRPAPQISVGALLPSGVTSDSELVDLFLSERVDPKEALARVAPILPEGVEATAAEEIGLTAPSLQSQVRWAEYEVHVPGDGVAAAGIARAAGALLAADSLPSEYRRENKVRNYDLRPLVLDLRLVGESDGCLVLRMRLRAEPEMTGRADQVVLALGLPPARRIHRRRLYVEESQPVVMAYRRLGEPEAR